MGNFWDFNSWGTLNIVAALMIGLLLANLCKRNSKLLQKSLIPTPVLAGIILLIISNVYGLITGTHLFETGVFSNAGNTGLGILEIITYHALALGFIAQTLVESPRKFTKKRSIEVFNTGVTTVATYLLQGVAGMAITIVIALTVMPDLLEAAGLLLPFGYGQGSGQALNYGGIYETTHGFIGGKSFGLTIAAFGFISASIGGVIHMHIMKRRGTFVSRTANDELTPHEAVEGKGEIPMNGAIDKLTVQIAFILFVYVIAYAVMYGLGSALPGMKSVIYGFNFLFGVLFAVLFKFVLKAIRKTGRRQYTNNFLLTHLSNFFFDVMIVSGIAAIRIDTLKKYFWVVLVLGVVGLIVTYLYNHYVARKLFPEYTEEQFLAMYGMLTGTASTGVMLLREADPAYETPAADNLVYQNLPAIIFGFPLMFLATMAPEQPYLVLLILFLFFVVMNLILFRSFIFKRKRNAADKSE